MQKVLKPNLKGLLITLVLVMSFFILNSVHAAGLTVGNNAQILNLPHENLFYGVTSGANATGSFLLLERGYGNPVFRIDYAGNITTNGSLLGSNSYWNFSGNNLFASSTAWNVGIGTTTPAYKLVVNGAGGSFAFDSATMYLRAFNAAGAATNFNFGGGAYFTGNLFGSNFGDGVTNTQWLKLNSTTSSLWTANTERLTILNGGNVGISSTTPNYKLDVNGTGAFNQPVVVGTPTGATHAATKSYVDGLVGAGVGTGTTGQTLRHNGTSWVANSLLFNNGTNVGIGTTNPGAKLDVYGNTANTNTAQFGNFGLQSFTDVNGFISQNMYWNGSATIYRQTGQIALFQFVNGDIQFGAAPSGVAGTAATLTYPVVIKQGASANSLYINSSGNVGIGTTNPNSKLEIQDSSSSILRISRTTADSANEGTLYGSISFGHKDASYGEYRSSIEAISGGGGSARTQHLVFKTPSISSLGTEWMRITSSGNVGIGSTSPTYKLEVNGTGLFNQPVVVGTPTGATHATTKSYVDSLIGGGSGSTVGYWTMNGSNISNSNAGNVGIGTTNPGSTLHLYKNGQVGMIMENTQNADESGAAITFKIGGHTQGYIGADGPSQTSWGRQPNQWTFNLYDNAPMLFRTSNTDRMTITGGGSVGIGTTNPSGTLEIKNAIDNSSNWPVWVKSGAYAVNSITGIRIQNGGSSEYNDFKSVGIAAIADSIASNITGMGLYVGNSQMVHISSAGNVGIGSTTPNYKLDVNGTGAFNQPVVVGTPTGPTHATTKSYVDGLIGGSSSWTVNGTSIYNNNTGYVGVGKTNPTVKLDVNGKINALSSGTAGTLNVGGVSILGSSIDPGESRILEITNDTKLVLASDQLWNNNPGSEMLFSGRYRGDAAYQVAFGGIGAFKSSSSEYDPSGYLSFKTHTGSGVTEKLRITSSGNVGIGITNPDDKLNVSGDAHITGNAYSSKIVVNPTSGVGWYRLTPNTNPAGGTVYLNASIDNTMQKLEFSYNSRGWTATSTVGTITVSRNFNYNAGPVTKIRVGSNGTDQSYLDIYVSTATAPVAFTVYGTNGATFLASPVYNPATPPYSKTVDLATTGFSGTQTSDSSYIGGNALVAGNVGIGTINPLYQLDVNGTGAFNQPVIVGTPTGATHAATKSYVDGLIGGSSSWTVNGTSIYNNNTGNVGIGVTNPGYKLQVIGEVASLDGGGFRTHSSNGDNTHGAPWYGLGQSNITFTAGQPSWTATQLAGYFGLNFQTSGGQMILNQSGLVGIGTTNPKGKVDIDGNRTFGSKNINISSSWTPVLSINMPGDHTSAHAKITFAGNDWSCHSAVRYEGEFDIIDGAGSYGEPGRITYQTQNTAADQIQARLTHVDPNTINIELRTYDIEGDGFNCGASSASETLNYEVTGNFSNLTDNTGTITGSNAIPDLLLNKGNFGIGIINPTYRLDAAGGSYRFDNTVVVGTPTGPTHAATKSYVDGLIGGFWVANGSHIYNGNSGNVGIGTTDPLAKLHVVGASILSNSTAINPDSYYGSVVSGNVGDGGGWSAPGIGGNGGAAGGSWGLVESSGNLYFGFQNGAANGTMQTFMQVFGNRNVSLVPTSGNVGIGTTNPGTYKLNIIGNTDLNGLVDVSGNINGIGSNLISNFVLDTHPEGNTTMVPFINNDISYLTLRGGSCTDNLTGCSSSLFNGAPDYAGFSIPSIPAEGYIVEINFHRNFSYTDRIGVSFGNGSWLSRYIKLEVYDVSTSAWRTISETSNNSSPIYQVTTSGVAASYAISKMRWTFNDFPGPGFRISEIWLQNYSSLGPKEVFVARDGSTMFGTLNMTNTSQANTISFNPNGSSYFTGNLGIGTTNPTYRLDAAGGSYRFDNTVIVGTPTAASHAATKSYVDTLTVNAINTNTTTAAGDLNMGGKNITNVNKLTVSTIDPLYNIKGINYSTFASAIAGGVKEEYVGKEKLVSRNANGEYEAVIDFNNQNEGSDLWVWRHTVDFSDDNVQVLMTASGKIAQTYYLISGNKLTLRADKPVTVSYRLIGRRLDWMKWPTKALDQQEKASFIIK